MQDELNRTSGVALIDSVLGTIQEHLEDERRRVNEEIRNYPAPIPACDAQFNYLLEERVRIAQEFEGLKALVRESRTEQEHIKCIEEFVSSSKYITGEVEQRVRSALSSLSGPALTAPNGSV